MVKLPKLSTTEFLFSTTTTTTVCLRTPMTKGIAYVVVVDLFSPKKTYYHHFLAFSQRLFLSFLPPMPDKVTVYFPFP